MSAIASMPSAAVPETYGFDPWAVKFTVEQYQRMAELGILTKYDKVELLENFLVMKMTTNPPHDGSLGLFMTAFYPRIPAGWLLRVQQTLVLTDSQPEPDFAIVRGHPRNYTKVHPTASDVGVVVEVSGSSLLRDQRDKFRVFARAGVPQYWIINLVDMRVEIYTYPSGPADVPAYREFRNYHRGEGIPLILDGVEVANIPVADLLP
jgi:Uma2 family endonuclease